jgi:hypothetical protein
MGLRARRWGSTSVRSAPSTGSGWEPMDDAFIESLNGDFRAECLNAEWLISLDEPPQNSGLGVATTASSVRRARYRERSVCGAPSDRPATAASPHPIKPAFSAAGWPPPRTGASAPNGRTLGPLGHPRFSPCGGTSSRMR